MSDDRSPDDPLDRPDGTVLRASKGAVWVLSTGRDGRRALVGVWHPDGGCGDTLRAERAMVERMEVVGTVPGTPAAEAETQAIHDRPRSGPHLLRASIDRPSATEVARSVLGEHGVPGFGRDGSVTG